MTMLEAVGLAAAARRCCRQDLLSDSNIPGQETFSLDGCRDLLQEINGFAKKEIVLNIANTTRFLLLVQGAKQR